MNVRTLGRSTTEVPPLRLQYRYRRVSEMFFNSALVVERTNQIHKDINTK